MSHDDSCVLPAPRWTCALFVFLVLVAARAEAQIGWAGVPGEDYKVELGVVFWTPSPQVILRADRPGIIGTEISLVRDFGIEDETFTEFRATLKPAGSRDVMLFANQRFESNSKARPTGVELAAMIVRAAPALATMR